MNIDKLREAMINKAKDLNFNSKEDYRNFIDVNLPEGYIFEMNSSYVQDMEKFHAFCFMRNKYGGCGASGYDKDEYMSEVGALRLFLRK